jgi:5-methylcytosine-specific restriction endonuclease McrA
MTTLDYSLVDEAETDSEQDDDEALELPANQRRVLTQSLDASLESLVSRIRRGRLILQPDFQRDYVWSRSKASALIESILMRIPLPVIYVSELNDGSWEMVDGQQRLTAIRSFVDGMFPNGHPFRLGRLRVLDDLRGKSFTELSPEEQGAIEDYSLRVIMIQKEADPDLKFEVFERLNSGADRLNDMELRNCIYRGPYNDLLKELVKNETFLRIRGESAPDARMQDRQLLLRFFAMWRNTHLRYRSPMKQFLNHEMQEHRFASADKIAIMRRTFEEAIQCAWDVFGAKAFRRYSRGDERDPDGKWEAGSKLNVALWDTILYVFAYYERRQIVPIADAVREEFLDLLASDDHFVDYIGRTTDKPDRVRYRAETWKRRLDGLINAPANETRAFSSALKQKLYDNDPSCAICHQHVHSLDDAEIDHVVHYWRGGRTIPENARLTHRYCNRRRGGRA